jgi:hypothetical protein
VSQGILHKEGSQYVGRAWIKAEGGAASLYVRDPKDRIELLPKLKTYLSSLPGVAHVYTNQEARSIGLPADADTDQAPQLYLVAAPGFAFADETTGEIVRSNPPRGQHGYLNTMSDMQALFLASGSAIKPGVALGPISNLQVAPTIAKILGVSLPDAQQPPLQQILR